MDSQTGVYCTSILAHVVVVLHVQILTRVSYGHDIPDEFMLVTTPHNRTIYYFGPGSFIPTSVPVKISVEPIAIGYDPVESRVYWTEEYSGIFSAFLNGTGKRVLQTYNFSSNLPRYNLFGLAVDHISRLVFYTDYANGRIATISITTLEHKLLVNTDLSQPRDIVLDIINGVMFWTDTGFPKIERANYDGSDRRHIVNTSLMSPICLALDVSNGFLYWGDTNVKPRLERCNLDGQDRKLIVEFTAYSVFLGLAFDGENLFLVDSPAGFSNDTGQNFIQRISTDGNNITQVFKDFHVLCDVYIWSRNNSQIGPNGCGNNNGGCSHMCLPLPGNTSKCTCPDGKNCSLALESEASMSSTNKDETTNGNTFIIPVIVGTVITLLVAIGVSVLVIKRGWLCFAKRSQDREMSALRDVDADEERSTTSSNENSEIYDEIVDVLEDLRTTHPQGEEEGHYFDHYDLIDFASVSPQSNKDDHVKQPSDSVFYAVLEPEVLAHRFHTPNSRPKEESVVSEDGKKHCERNHTIIPNTEITDCPINVHSALPQENPESQEDNYLQAECDEKDNYLHAVSDEKDNYLHAVSDEKDNYLHPVSDEKDNYLHAVSDEKCNYLHAISDEKDIFSH